MSTLHCSSYRLLNNDYTTRVDGLVDINRPEDLKNLLRTVRLGSKHWRNKISGNLPIPKGSDWKNMLKDNETILMQMMIPCSQSMSWTW